YRLGPLGQALLDGLYPVEGHLGGLLLDVELDAEAPEIVGALVHVRGKLVALPVRELLDLLERAVVAIELAVNEKHHQDEPEGDEVPRREQHAGQYKPFPYTEEVRYLHDHAPAPRNVAHRRPGDRGTDHRRRSALR